MLGRKVQHAEHVAVVLYLGSVGYGKADAGEDVDNLFAYEAQGVTCSQLDGVRRAREVEVFCCCVGLGVYLLFEFVKAGFDALTHLINDSSPLGFFVLLQGLELIHECSYFTFLRQQFEA